MDFDMLGLAPRLTAALSEQGLTQPTPIQAQAIPHVMDGRDVMGLAQTGTGKTAAYGLPMLDALLKDGGKAPARGARALVLAPTRELVNQIADSLGAFAGEGSHLRVLRVVGGVGINPQIKRLEKGAHVLVATPGRLIDLLDRKAVSLSETGYLVLDEADQMLDMGFIHALRTISKHLPEERQTLLFSATMPKLMAEIAGSYLKDPVRVQVAPPGKAVEKIDQEVHFVAKAAKGDLLVEMLEAHKDERAIVFGRTKWGMEKLAKQLDRQGFAVAAIHGAKSQGQRERALQGFREGTLKVLVATDVAARGLDIPEVRHVYNFELPNVAENYVHRIGRTARAGADGRAVAFCAPDEMGDLKDIEKAMKAAIPVASGRPWEVEEQPAKKSGGGGRGRRGGGGGGGRPQGAGGGSKPQGGAGRAGGGGKPGGGLRRGRGGAGRGAKSA
ncbi:DEAD/DEAH box helicase [Wenxinia saemankumensis]|uniref:ATP-dependent RNA helicase RhlE n=1 Tax=Wenxinia saemankumensis TaxID=1447782 RepID=A0A1M6ES37_9RHOB|nr:DEAD/DEAH box helicase [Wenxinia saemankumensis]SHI88267.1 ATP-dependent RNA helicase RhlE [Wenxinia saemankumensis]